MAAAARILSAGILILGLALAAPVLGDSVRKVDGDKPQAVDPGYIVQAGDSLTITVWKEQDLQGEFLVRPGLDVAGGHTVDEIRTALTTRLTKYIPDPVVTVGVKTVNGSMIFVVGKVARPGNFLLSRPIDVLPALSLAGGATPFADVNGIRVLRREAGGQQHVFRFRYDDVRRGRDLAQNILL